MQSLPITGPKTATTGSPDYKIYCGTSGFAYDTWKPGFYPEKLPSAKYLSHYARRLNAVEVNYTYRRIASQSTFEKWIASTPDGFLFLPKAHMKITHSLKLKDADEFTQVFLNSLEPLLRAGRLGPILYQLPPSLKIDLELLSNFIAIFPSNVRSAFEFRHSSWFTDGTYELLKSKNIGLCMAENENLETPHVLTADFAYLRLRKPDYSDEEVAGISQRIKDYARTAFVIFKHEDTPEGALNAEKVLAAFPAGNVSL